MDDGDESLAGELVSYDLSPVAETEDLVDDKHDAGLLLALRVHDPGADGRAACGILDVHELPMARTLVQRRLGLRLRGGGLLVSRRRDGRSPRCLWGRGLV